MTVNDVAQWERAKELAYGSVVTIRLKGGFELTDSRGHMLGVFGTVAEVLAFLCGYEHSDCKRIERTRPDRERGQGVQSVPRR